MKISGSIIQKGAENDVGNTVGILLSSILSL